MMLGMRSALTPAVLAALLGCTVGGEGDSSFSAGASASGGADASASATDGASSGETTGAAEHGSVDGSDDAAASTGDASDDDGAAQSSGTDTSTTGDDASSGSSTTPDADGSSTGEPDDLDDGILDIVVTAHDDCTFTTLPASITVPEGTEFTVNWISAASSDIPFDIAKIDPFNQVPIVIGMEPGTAYHDEVRTWCGALFTGTFDFRVTSCFDPQYIPVDCGG